jgi:hypothetical protein
MHPYEWFTRKATPGGRAIEVVEVGRLHVPSGAVVAFDPLVLSPPLPAFVRRIPPGTYAVLVARLAGTRVVAAAQLRLSEGAPVTWEKGLLEPGGVPDGYAVDSGMGAFADAETVRLALASDDHGDGGFVRDAIEEAEDDADDPWLMFDLPGTEGRNVALFNSGHGDGFYLSCWGSDAAGKAACLLTDFQIDDSASADDGEDGEDDDEDDDD